MIKVIYMAKPKITFYDLSDKEYRKVVDAINLVAPNGKRTSYIIIDELTEITGNPPTYGELILHVETKEGHYESEKDEAITVMKGLISLLDF